MAFSNRTVVEDTKTCSSERSKSFGEGGPVILAILLVTRECEASRNTAHHKSVKHMEVCLEGRSDC